MLFLRAISAVVFIWVLYVGKDLRMAPMVHKMSLVDRMLLVADDLFHKNPYIHAAWHLAATISVSTCNKLLEWWF
ncbi:hypothetical protein HN873_007621 [Arachis hypogaea]